MAFETIHILIMKLNLIGRDLTNHPGLKSKVVSSSIEELKHLREILEIEENYYGRNQTNHDKWDKLLEDIYAVEDDIETLLERTMLQSCKVQRNRNASARLSSEEILSNNIKNLTYSVRDYCNLIQPNSSSGTGVAQSQAAQSKDGQVSEIELIPKSSTGSQGLQVSTVKETIRRNAVTIVLADLVKKLTQQLLSRFTLQYLFLTVDGTYLGKAILLWTVYNAYDIQGHFHCRAWVHVSEELGQREIVHAILTKVTGDKRQPLQSPQSSLHDFLVSKRYLIVLYGVQTVGFWDNIKAAFPYSMNGSRVIAVVRGQIKSWILQRHHLSSRKLMEQLPDGWLQASTYLKEKNGIGKVEAGTGKLPQFKMQDGWPQASTYLEEEYGIASVEVGTGKLAELILNPYILLFLISIKGIIGSGRTTLLWPMYNAKDVKQYFQCRAWVQVPQKYHEEDVLTNILEQVASVKLIEKLSVESLRKRLRKFLTQKRYLVVLYDVWTGKFWDTLRLSLPNSLNGSRVIYALSEGETNEVQKISSSISGVGPVRNFPGLKGEQEDVLDQESSEYFKEEGSSIVGFDDKIKELAELTFNSYKLHFLISVLGVAGSGKTILVRTIYNSVACKRHFKCRAWVSVPAKLDDFNERQLLIDLLGQLRNAKQKESLSLMQLRERLRLFLTWKRYLIVLDDVPTPDTWQRFNEFFPNISNGSRVIITTRNAYLAYHINPETVVLKLRCLTDDESWDLFLIKVQTVNKIQTDINDLQLKEKILQSCLGLPLRIVLLGGLLSKKGSYDEWPSVIEHSINKMEKAKKVQMNPSDISASADTKQEEEKRVMVMDHKTTGKDQKDVPSQLTSATTKKGEDKKKLQTDTISGEDLSNSSDQLTFSDQIPLSDIMTSAYQDLTPHLKCCLLYLGLFPKSYEIPIRRLYLLWLAEGLVMPEHSTQNPEELVKEYFEELKRRNMLEVTEHNLNGSPKKGRVPNTIYDILFRDTEKVGFFHISNDSAIMGSQWFNIRRLSENFDISRQSEQIENRIRRLRSYISFYGKRGDAATDGVKEVISKVVEKGFGMLVVLDLEGVYKPVLSDNLGELPSIKYLGLRRTLLDDVPKSIGNLSHLETLDIKHTFITKLPSSIWKAKKLQYLYTNDIDVDLSTLKHSTCGSLSNVKILWGLVIRKGSPHKNWMQSLVGLRKLKLTCNEEANDVIVPWIAKMEKLQSLNLRLIDKFNQPLNLGVDEMRKWKQESLSQLYLLGKLPELSDLPQYLEILTLSMTHLLKDPMEMLGELKQLKVLRLYAQSFLGSEMSCKDGKFPELRVLKLWMLYKLNSWNVQEGTMPKLREVEIRCCKNLKMPDGLKTLTSLKELTLANMKEEFVTNVETSLGGKVAIMKNFCFSSSWD